MTLCGPSGSRKLPLITFNYQNQPHQELAAFVCLLSRSDRERLALVAPSRRPRAIICPVPPRAAATRSIYSRTNVQTWTFSSQSTASSPKRLEKEISAMSIGSAPLAHSVSHSFCRAACCPTRGAHIWNYCGRNPLFSSYKLKRWPCQRFFPKGVKSNGLLASVWSAPLRVDTVQAARLTIRRVCSCSNLIGLRYPSAEWSRLLL